MKWSVVVLLLGALAFTQLNAAKIPKSSSNSGDSDGDTEEETPRKTWYWEILAPTIYFIRGKVPKQCSDLQKGGAQRHAAEQRNVVIALVGSTRIKYKHSWLNFWHFSKSLKKHRNRTCDPEDRRLAHNLLRYGAPPGES
ncbi:unnamed protein product [Caenorhabditis auriculariae]|uniref:Uncharacterized protein n=1 Tax=Caenorhabditis auriculariae TaxID=2777116 RepID=A0A8S1HN35_9PELO|nr:unnamed protein product [Caenorhabditis auriculariae]